MTTSTTETRAERRRAVRALADFPIRLSPDAEAKPAQLRDISELGLACTFGSKLEEMTLVSVQLALPGQSLRHDIKGAIVRCEPLPKEKGRYDVAIWFTEIAPSTKAALRNYVRTAKPAP